MNVISQKKRFMVHAPELTRMGLDPGQEITSEMFNEQLIRLMDRAETGHTGPTSSNGSPASTEQLEAIECAVDEAKSEMKNLFVSESQGIKGQLSELIAQLTRLAELRNFFATFRTEIHNFMHHIMNENAAVRRLLDRLTCDDPEELATLKREIDQTFQASRAAVKEFGEKYNEIYDVLESRFHQLRLLEGAEITTEHIHQAERIEEEELEMER